MMVLYVKCKSRVCVTVYVYCNSYTYVLALYTQASCGFTHLCVVFPPLFNCVYLEGLQEVQVSEDGQRSSGRRLEGGWTCLKLYSIHSL